MPRKQPQNDGGAFLYHQPRVYQRRRRRKKYSTILLYYNTTYYLLPIMFTFNFEHRSYHPRFPCQLLHERNLLAAKTWQALTLPSLSHHGYNLMNGDQPQPLSFFFFQLSNLTTSLKSFFTTTDRSP